MSALLDRYLSEIDAALPKDIAKDDIIAEIRDELESQIEEGKDEAVVIKAYGHPRVVAARYGRAQYLIGPELFPFYGSTLRNTLVGGVALVLAGGAIAAIVAHNGSLFFDSLGIAWRTALWIVAIVTLLFVAAEHTPHGDWFDGKPYAALVEFVANVLAVLVLLDAWGPHRIPFDTEIANVLATSHATLTAAWHAAYFTTLACAAMIAVSALILFIRPSWMLPHEAVRAGAGTITIIGLAITLANGPWVVAPESGWNIAAQWCLIGAIVCLLISVVNSIRSIRHSLVSGRVSNAWRGGISSQQ